MTDRQVYGVSQCIDAITAEKNKDLIDYVLKNMTRKLVDVAVGKAFDGEKIISIKDEPIKINKYINALIYRKRMYVEDLTRCRDCANWNANGDTHRCFVWCVYTEENGFCHRAVRRENE